MENKELNYFKKKKHITIFVVSFSFSIFIAILSVFYFKNLYDKELYSSLFLVFIILYVILIVYLRSKLTIYNMNFHYLKMIDDNLGLIEVKHKIYTKSWLESFSDMGFKKSVDNNEYIIYYQFYNKLPNMGKTGHALVAVIVSKTSNYDFFDNEVNFAIERLYEKYESQHKVKKQIVIQYKKYNEYKDEYKDELQEIINYKNGGQVVISFPVGYFVNENKIYYLRPVKTYFNKFHYYTNNLIMKLSNIKGEEDE